MPNTFNENGVCIDPEIPYQYFEKGRNYPDFYIKVAYHPEGGWCFGYTWPNGTCPCMKNVRTGLLPTRGQAVKDALNCLLNVAESEIRWHGKAARLDSEGGDTCGYMASYKQYKRLHKIVKEWIAKESEPIQLSLFE